MKAHAVNRILFKCCLVILCWIISRVPLGLWIWNQHTQQLNQAPPQSSEAGCTWQAFQIGRELQSLSGPVRLSHNIITLYQLMLNIPISKFRHKGSLLKQWRRTMTNDSKMASGNLQLITQLRGLRWRYPQFHHYSIQNETH